MARKKTETVKTPAKNVGHKEGTRAKEKVETRHEISVQAQVNIGLAGHVDAGKTSLTQALTGKWTDTHSEELKRGISIRLGYADTVFYQCENCKGLEAFSTSAKCKICGKNGKILRKVSFVDAPGHETLMTTMLSGAALMNGAILVVAANEECPQPQTVEHVNALIISGIEKVVVVQNKVDLVTREQAEKNYEQILVFLKNTPYKNAPVIPVAAHFQANVDVLIKTLEEIIPSPVFELDKPLKMYCARSFDINKPGTQPEQLHGAVLGGSIIQGTIKKGDRVEITPWLTGKKIQTTVVSVSTEQGNITEGKPGGLLAIETTLDPSIAQNDQLKGQNIGAVSVFPEPVTNVNLEVHLLERVIGEPVKRLNMGEDVVLTIGTATALGTVAKAQGSQVNINLRKPAVGEKNHKVAISKREQMKWRLVAYGIVK